MHQERSHNLEGDKLKEHIKRVHKEKKFLCEACKLEFQSNQDVDIHVKNVHANSAAFICQVCQTKLQSYREMSVHIEENHEEVKVQQETIIQNEANIVIKSITEKFKQIQDVEKKETEHLSLKRANSVSPAGVKSKNSKIEVIPMTDIEEDLRLVKEEVRDLKAENLELRKKVKDIDSIKTQNEQLRKQLKEQEEDTISAIKAIETQIELETQKVINQNKEESKSLSKNSQQEIQNLEKQFKKKFAELSEEKDKILEEMTKMQGETDLEREKKEAIDKKNKIETNLKLFNILVENGHELTELPIIEKEKKSDECIASISCEGDCENVNQLKRLNSLKQSGNSRSCPQNKSVEKPMYRCEKCDFISQNKVYFDSHMKSHMENRIKSNLPTKKPCSYFGSRYGCRKGDQCDYDHSESAQAKPVVKVRKLCRNGESCVWTPRCRYVHPENGEVLPVRSVERNTTNNALKPNFGVKGLSQQPPGWNSLIPPATCPPPPTTRAPGIQVPQVDQERRNKVITDFLQLIVPNLMCMTDFPSLEKSQSRKI